MENEKEEVTPIQTGQNNSEEKDNINIPLNDTFFTGVITDTPPKRFIEPNYITQTTFGFLFWQFKYNKDIKNYELKGLYHEGIRRFLAHKGYYKRYINPQKSILILQQGCIIEEISPENVKDIVLREVDSYKENLDFKYNDIDYSIPIEALRTIFLQQSNNFFNDNWLEHLPSHETPILKDTEYKCFFVLKNCLVQVSKKDGVEVEALDKIKEFCVWKSQQSSIPIKTFICSCAMA